MRLIFFKFFIQKELQFYIVTFKITSFWGHTALETFLPLLIAVLELRYWNNLQLVGYSPLNIFDCPKMISLEVIFQLWKEKKVTRTQVRLIRRLRSHRNAFTGQKLVYWNCCVAGVFGTIFAQIFLIPNSLVKIWWTVVWVKFNSSPIILTVNRRSERTRSRILSTFSSVLEDEGLPLRGSSSIDSLPSENALNHRKTWALDKTLSP